MLIGMVIKGVPVDLTLFADTGGEKPHTYRHVERFSEWLVGNGYPPVITVRYARETLEANCLRIKSLPSIAYGYKKCSLKFKRDPQNKYCNNWTPAKQAWKRGEKVIKLIGYDATEARRGLASDKKYVYRYPLIEWGWTRDKCLEVCESAGFEVGKSACFYCPSSKAHEIKLLKKQYPDLANRALAMESNAVLTDIKGLGRDFSWREMLDFDEAQMKMFDENWSTNEMPCGCYDG